MMVNYASLPLMRHIYIIIIMIVKISGNHINDVRSELYTCVVSWHSKMMALSATLTVTPQIQRALENFLHNPVIEKGTVNRDS